MPWTNSPLVLFHGTTDSAVSNIMAPVAPNRHGINLGLCRPLADFGQGFYFTTYLHQAKNWANNRCLGSLPGSNPIATVLSFDVDRNLLGQLQTLVFLRDDSNYWDFVMHCRSGLGPHRPTGQYDVVFGPVSLWPQTLVIANCDQISCHTTLALAILPNPIIEAQGTLGTPLLQV